MTDVLDWTPEGRKALADEYTWARESLRDVDRAKLRAKLDASLARFVHCWDLGLVASNGEGKPRADERGRAAVEHAKAWIGHTPSKVSVAEAASALSLLGARSDSHDAALAEMLLRDHGYAFMVRVLVEMWSMATNYHDPDWPKSEERLAIWLFGISEGADPSWVNDSSVSHGKGNLAAYLASRMRIAPRDDVRDDSDDAGEGGGPTEGDADREVEAERAELRAAIDAAWADAPLFARPALAIAADDRGLAERAMREIFDASPPWYPHYARNNLPSLIGDRTLLDKLGFIKGGRAGMRWLERMGIEALPIYEAMYSSKITKRQREQLTKQLVNIRGPVVAKLLAPYAEKAPFVADIRAYFTRAPELLAIVRADKSLAPYAAQLEKLAAKIGVATPASKASAVKPSASKASASKSSASKASASKASASKSRASESSLSNKKATTKKR
jgi:hypothetical protein